jgi:protease IV
MNPPPVPAATVSGPATIVIQSAPQPTFWSRAKWWLLGSALSLSVLFNMVLLGTVADYFSADTDGPQEKYSHGSQTASDKIAIIKVTGTIMAPFSGRVIKAVEKARDDDAVKGVVLRIDSPGGLVSDSHQIYHRLKELSAKKPVFVSFGSMAASGGYYIAMGAGPKGTIFAEPITWTGSIGVILPRYDASELAAKVGVKSDSIKTGEFKDALNPFQPLPENERKIWDDILGQSFDRFLTIIDENRDTLNREQIQALATGRIYTADDGIKNGLVDKIGLEEDAFKALQESLGLKNARGVEYSFPQTVLDVLLAQSQASDPQTQVRAMMESTVPREMYYFSWSMPEALVRTWTAR